MAALFTVAASRSHPLAASGSQIARTAGYTRAFGVSAFLLAPAALVAISLLPTVGRAAVAAVGAEQKRLAAAVLNE